MESATSYRPLVSILIPALNAEPWIAQCIDSALGQTYTPVEVIVVDDGSDDRTPEVVQTFGPRVSLVRTEHRGGNAARNTLLANARGEWVQYLDADDFLIRDKIEIQIRKIAADPDLDVVCSPVILSDESRGSEAPLHFLPALDMVLEFLRWGPLNTNGFLYKRAVLLEAGGWKETQASCQEHELLLRLLMQERRSACLAVPGAVYRVHGTATVSRKNPLRTARLQTELLDTLQSWLETSGRLSPRYRRALYVTRMETARKTWSIDRAFASSLAVRARSLGTLLLGVSSPALPFFYRLANGLLGFSAAERLASRQRSLAYAVLSHRTAVAGLRAFRSGRLQ